MGYSKSFRDLHDTHNGGNGLDNSTVNMMTGANAIFYSDDAVNPDNPSAAILTAISSGVSASISKPIGA